ncbi:MAG: CoA transferase [Bacteroidota bacterium]
MKDQIANKPRIFENIRILDFCQVIAGGYSTTIMADLGAEVVKVEPPVIGDTMRIVGPLHNGESAFFLLKSRNKKSICVDLKKAVKYVQLMKHIPIHIMTKEVFLRKLSILLQGKKNNQYPDKIF